MNLHVYHEPPPAEIGRALEAFESEFHYPLGASESFSISHGRDYVPFFRAIGLPTVLVVESRGRVLGTMAAAVRPLRCPDGEIRPTGYLGDLKVTRSVAGGWVLVRMFRYMRDCLTAPCGGRAYCVVMDGTRKLPNQYSGRLGMPLFEAVGSIHILRIAARDQVNPSGENFAEVSRERGEEIHERLVSSGHVTQGGDSSLRSRMKPVFLSDSRPTACGRLEDTRLGKRLFLRSGAELKAAHLSKFAYADIAAGAALLRQVAHRCWLQGFAYFFVAVPSEDSAALAELLGRGDVLPAPATVYGCGFEPSSARWHIDTAEI